MTVSHKYLCFIFITGTYIYVSEASSKFGFTGKNPNNSRWGCDFVDEYYDISSYVCETPVFGKSPIKTVNFESVREFKTAHNLIQNALEEVVENLNHNTVERFVQFYYDYSQGSLKYLTDFFAEYRPMYISGTGKEYLCISALERVAKKLKFTYPDIEGSLFLAGGEKDVSQQFVTFVTVENSADYLYRSYKGTPDVTYFEHMLGIMKISIGSKAEKKRNGYILLEASLGRTNPIVVMEDKKDPHTGFLPSGRNKVPFEYVVLPDNKDFILTVPKMTSTTDNSSIIYPYIIFVGKQYCSFLDTTAKYEVLSTKKEVLRRNLQGTVRGGYYISTVQPQIKEVSWPYFVLVIAEAGSKERKHWIPFSRIQSTGKRGESVKFINRNNIEKTDLEKIARILGYKLNNFLAELREVGDILEDAGFLKSLSKIIKSPMQNHVHFSKLPF